MSRRRKHVGQSAQHEIQPPKDNQYIARALGSRGDNLVEVEFPDGRKDLALLPARFNKQLWIRRGGFLIVEQGPEQQQQSQGKSRITATIEAVLFPADQSALRKRGCWPLEFESKKETVNPRQQNQPHGEEDTQDVDSSDNDLPPLEPNNNRPVLDYDFEDDESSSDEAVGKPGH